MKQVLHAVPSEDGGWKIIVETVPAVDGPEEGGPPGHVRGSISSGIPHDPTPFTTTARPQDS